MFWINWVKCCIYFCFCVVYIVDLNYFGGIDWNEFVVVVGIFVIDVLSVMNWILFGLVLISIEILIGVLVCLKGGKYFYEGWIEVLYNGMWKVVCDYGWDRNGVRVVCCMFGFFDVLWYIKGFVLYDLLFVYLKKYCRLMVKSFCLGLYWNFCK